MDREVCEPGPEGLGLDKALGAQGDVGVPHFQLDTIMTRGMGGL
ncbi:hypothetical protein HNP32_001416 [Brevundimonas bullata]|uniref:Uncharacterized protein n=1 Tax=Brevundimonas bullata TaxID=13160 RepID=A0A7W7INS6_9CAUL|nr:hypothetical protein [Brevundimonas bullata]MBB6382652.1 hypothetical protein [Brevundimonas bullata]